MILTIDVNAVMWFIGKVFLCLLVFWIVLEVILGGLYDRYCGDGSINRKKKVDKTRK